MNARAYQAAPEAQTANTLHASYQAAGFWDAFACWIARPFEGWSPVAEGWDALSDLADEEDYERSFDSPCERATP